MNLSHKKKMYINSLCKTLKGHEQLKLNLFQAKTLEKTHEKRENHEKCTFRQTRLNEGLKWVRIKDYGGRLFVADTIDLNYKELQNCKKQIEKIESIWIGLQF